MKTQRPRDVLDTVPSRRTVTSVPSRRRSDVERRLKASAFALLLLLLFQLPLATLSSETQSTGAFNLTLLATGNMRGRIFPVDKWNSLISMNAARDAMFLKYGGGFGGLAQSKAYVDAVRRRENNTLFLSTGNLIHGTLFYVNDKGKAMMDLVGEME